MAELTERELLALAREALAADHEHHRRLRSTGIGFALLIGLPLVGALAWAVLIGYQSHVVEIHQGDLAVRLVSRSAPFEVYQVDSITVVAVNGGIFAQIDEHLEGPEIEPRLYDWATIAATEQVVNLPQSQGAFPFIVNGLMFQIEGREIYCGERRWLLVPGSVVTIDVDTIPVPASAPVRPPAESKVSRSGL